MKYCIQDVNILGESCLKFRQLIAKQVDIDLFADCCTIASLTTRIWHTNFMPERTVGVLPENNYVTRANASYKAIGLMDYQIHKTGEHIQHYGRGGEVKVSGFFVDGMVEETTCFMAASIMAAPPAIPRICPILYKKV